MRPLYSPGATPTKAQPFFKLGEAFLTETNHYALEGLQG